jgi:selenocysteine lyase/cysteine desulfurase
LECSTLNLLRVIGLCEALDFLEKETAESIRRREMALLARLRDGLIRIDGVTIYCADDLADHVGLLTASRENTNPGKVGAIMDGDFDIAVRVRLNRASLVHESLSASPREGVRFSVGPCTTKEDIDRAAFPVVEIAKAKGEALNRIRLVLAPYSYVPS